MDFHCELLLDQYDNNQKIYNKMLEVIRNHVNDYVSAFGTIINSVDSIVKTRASLAEK